MSELRALLERFAKRKSMDIIFDAANSLIDDANMDEELEAWFKDLKLYVRKVRFLPPIPRRERQIPLRQPLPVHWGPVQAMGEDPTNKRFAEEVDEGFIV